MGSVIFGNFSSKKTVDKTSDCAGCGMNLLRKENVRVFKLTYENEDELIALCHGCYKIALDEGAL